MGVGGRGRAGDGEKGHKKEMEEKITVSRGILRLILGVLFNTCSGLLREGQYQIKCHK